MLDRNVVAAQIVQLKDALFKPHKKITWLSAAMLNNLAQLPVFQKQLAQAGLQMHDELLCLSSTAQVVSDYSILGVDGSQIYPDHHMQGVACFLINTGGCFFRYGDQSSAYYFSSPLIVTQQRLIERYAQRTVSTDFVDLMREEYEFNQLVEQAAAHKDLDLALFDGNLLFWHLETKGAYKDLFLKRYLASCQQLYDHKVLHAGYLSASQSTDLLALLSQIITDPSVIKLIGHESIYTFASQADTLCDAELLYKVLSPGQRTTLMKAASSIVSQYPEALAPYFFYMHVGAEVVRIEVPAWIAADQQKINRICSLVLDQVHKGFGYPVALAEAHNRAVVTGADREFFFSLIIQKAPLGDAFSLSPKSLKKRIIPF